ncbi:MAG: hypothetical protein C4324_01555 [Blastocatellia bacterium]
MFILEGENGIILSVKVIPRAAKTALAGVTGNFLRVRIKAPPIDNAANETLCDFLAKTLRVRRGAVNILSGAASRTKRLYIDGIGRSEALDRLGISPLPPVV